MDNILIAKEGMVFIDKQGFYGKKIFLGEGRTADEFHEITEAEAEAIEKAQLEAAGITQEV